MGLASGGSLFGRGDVRDTPDYTKGSAKTFVSEYSGAGSGTTTMYTVPPGKKFIVHFMTFTSYANAATSYLYGQTPALKQIFKMEDTITLNTNFFGDITPIFPAGTIFKHYYSTGDVAGQRTVSITGIEIDDD